MEVYEFDKCLLDRLNESMNVLCWKHQVIPASQVRHEWSYFIELQIEPAGWQALWKIPRVICAELQLRYPTVVFGYVEQVLFKELKAIFLVQAVQDEDVHLPERHEVALEDLWPTRTQENSEVNVERTADCLDRLRFFYTHVWMPWDNDNDDDQNWVEKHLESRIRFCYDLRKRSMKRALSAHIRQLLLEARYIQQRREYLELDLSDDEAVGAQQTLNDSDLKDKSQITDLMRLHLRLAMIRSEIELLENPELRHIFEEIKFDEQKHLKHALKGMTLDKSKNNNNTYNNNKQPTENEVSYIVTQPNALARQLELLQLTQRCLSPLARVQLCPTLQDVLTVCDACDSIFLAPGCHTIKFLEYLNDNGRICGLVEKSSGAGGDAACMRAMSPARDAILMSPDDDSILLVFDGDFTLEHLVLDCAQVRTGILVKQGHVRLRHCRLIGDGKTSTQLAFNLVGNAQLTLDNCSVERFSTGIAQNASTLLHLNACKFIDCAVALDITGPNTILEFEGSFNVINDASKCGIYISGMYLDNTNAKYVTLQNMDEIKT